MANLSGKLSSQERAKLTFEALCFGDQDTANKITDTVPHYEYKVIDFDYRISLNNYFHVGYIWSAEYWKSYCKMLAIMGMKADDHTPNKAELIDRVDELNQLHSFWEHRLIALGLILKSLKQSHGIDLATLPYFADAQTIYGLELEIDHLEGD